MAFAGPASAEAPEAAEALQVRAENNSAPELCAEKDNVELDFISPRVRSLQIQAARPSYINTIASDRWAPDWSSYKFRRGGEGRLSIKSVDQDRITLDVSFSQAMPNGSPFAALRSMYGRHLPSRHNLSAPDMLFSKFQGAPPASARR